LETTGDEAMAIFVLVHGAFLGAWCWTKLAPEPAARGHRAVTFDLPGGGEDRTPIEQTTLDTYAARVTEEISPQSEPVLRPFFSSATASAGYLSARLP
jgi:pimeloyl-ACP methyl ester carboxylesterase